MSKPVTRDDEARWLGSGDLPPKEAHICVFVPSQTREGKPLKHDWRSETVTTMSSIFGGATSVKGFGGWLDEEREGKIKEEAISMVVSFITEDEWIEGNILKSGTAEFLANDAEARKIYLGEKFRLN